MDARAFGMTTPAKLEQEEASQRAAERGALAQQRRARAALRAGCVRLALGLGLGSERALDLLLSTTTPTPTYPSTVHPDFFIAITTSTVALPRKAWHQINHVCIFQLSHKAFHSSICIIATGGHLRPAMATLLIQS